MPSALSNRLFDYLPNINSSPVPANHKVPSLLVCVRGGGWGEPTTKYKAKNTDIQAFVQAKIKRIERAAGNVQWLQDSSSKYFNPLAGILLLYQLSVIKTNAMETATC